MRTMTTLALVTALCALALTTVNAQRRNPPANPDWVAAEKLLKDTKAPIPETVDAIDKLRGQADYTMSMALLGYFDQCDDAWRGDGSKDRLGRPTPGARPPQAYRIAQAILKVVRGMNSSEEVLKFEPHLGQNDKYSLRVRTAMIDAIARHFEVSECAALLLKLAKDASFDTDMRVLAVLHLGDHLSSRDVLDTLLAALRDRSWRIRDVSVMALAHVGTAERDRVVLALINALAAETGRLRKTIVDSLNRITGARLGTDPDEWIEWYRNRKREEEGLPPTTGKGDRGTRTRVFETDSFSDRYVFVLDCSVSMLQPITPEEKEKLQRSITGKGGEEDKRRPLDWSQINNKLDLAREEIIRSLEVMNPEVTRFTIISFAEDIKVFKEELLATDAKNIKDAAGWMRAIKGSHRTNVFGAVNAALDLSEKLAGIEVEKRKPGGRGGKVITGPHADEALPDTIYLYTDGYATWGKYAGEDKPWQGKSQEERAKLYNEIMKLMVEEIGDRNRVARIAINTVGVGNPQDNTTLGMLARRCRGEYVALGR